MATPQKPQQQQQVLVIKGWEGFADRLQVLSDGIHYCIKNDAALCIDWRDYMWGQKKEDFSDYFDIVNVTVVQLSDVANRLEKGASIMPSVWTPKLLREPPSEIIHFGNFKLNFDNYAKINSDIVVVNGKGLRTWHIDNLINNIKVKDSVIPIVVGKINKLKLPYTAIHLRGTDRFSPESLKTLTAEYDGLQPHAKARVYLVSDMKDLVEAWVAKNPTSLRIDENPCIFKIPPGSQGTHMYEQETLDYYNVSKHDLNVNTIVDFLVIAFANWTYGNKASVFISMAHMMRQAGVQGVSKWLNGYIPPRAAL